MSNPRTPVIIDVDGVPTLFSPVLAHALEPGDLISHDDTPARVRMVSRNGLSRYMCVTDDDDTWLMPVNVAVLRAVGARGGRGGAR